MWRFTVLTNGLVVLTLKAFLAPVANLGFTSCYIIGDSRLNVAYKDLGDLNVGGLFSASAYDEKRVCGGKVSRSVVKEIRAMEILAYTVREVNANDSLLPGIKLGFVFLDFCSSVHAAMVQAARLLPRSDPSDYTPSNRSNHLMSFRVVGLLGAYLNHVTTPISILFSGAGLPVVTFWEGGDVKALQDEKSTFLHLSTRKHRVVDAMMQYLKANKWSLVSLIVENNEEGAFLYGYARQMAHKEQICISVVQYVTLTSDFHIVFEYLLASRAKVGLVLISTDVARIMTLHMESEAIIGKIVWLVTDSWLHLRRGERPVHGIIMFSPFSMGVVKFHVEKESLNENPWFRELLRQENCRSELCIKYTLIKIDSMFTIDELNIHDVLMVYVYGLHNLIRDKCPHAKGSAATLCFESNSQDLMSYLKAAAFIGLSGSIVEGSSGNKLDQEEINVYQDSVQEKHMRGARVSTTLIAKYNARDKSMTIFDNITFEWATFHLNELNISTLCKITCSPNDAKVIQNSCCWSCRRCQDDERIINNQTACEKCPMYHWPAFLDGVKSVCEEIPVKTFELTDPASLATLASDVAGLLLLVIVLVRILYCNELISRCPPDALVFIELTSIFCGLASVPLLVSYPVYWKCNIAYVLFVISFSALYIALLLDSVYLYRQCDDIVDEQLLGWTCATNQFAFVLCVICVEVAIFILLFFLSPVGPVKSQLIGEKCVEFSCKIPSSHVVSFLLFTIPILMICMFFSLKAQNDTIGCHQSRYMSTFYVISLITWIVFMPSYFTASRLAMRSYYLVFVLIGNHISALVLNYYPEYLLSFVLAHRKDSDRLFKRLLSVDKGHLNL